MKEVRFPLQKQQCILLIRASTNELAYGNEQPFRHFHDQLFLGGVCSRNRNTIYFLGIPRKVRRPFHETGDRFGRISLEPRRSTFFFLFARPEVRSGFLANGYPGVCSVDRMNIGQHIGNTIDSQIWIRLSSVSNKRRRF